MLDVFKVYQSDINFVLSQVDNIDDIDKVAEEFCDSLSRRSIAIGLGSFAISYIGFVILQFHTSKTISDIFVLLAFMGLMAIPLFKTVVLTTIWLPQLRYQSKAEFTQRSLDLAQALDDLSVSVAKVEAPKNRRLFKYTAP